MVCNALVAGGWRSGAGQQAIRPGWYSQNFPHPGRIVCCSTPTSKPPATKALHTICGNNTIIVSSSWWWAYECPKYFEQIIIAIHHSAASMWFSFLCLYYKAWTNIHQIYHCLSLCSQCISLCHGSQIHTTDRRTLCRSQSNTETIVEPSANMAALQYRSVIHL